MPRCSLPLGCKPDSTLIFLSFSCLARCLSRAFCGFLLRFARNCKQNVKFDSIGYMPYLRQILTSKPQKIIAKYCRFKICIKSYKICNLLNFKNSLTFFELNFTIRRIFTPTRTNATALNLKPKFTLKFQPKFYLILFYFF